MQLAHHVSNPNNVSGRDLICSSLHESAQQWQEAIGNFKKAVAEAKGQSPYPNLLDNLARTVFRNSDAELVADFLKRKAQRKESPLPSLEKLFSRILNKTLKPKNFQTCGFAHVPYPQALRVAVEAAMRSWKEFCALPKEEKQAFAFVEGPGDGVGFEFKEGTGPSREKKENFHITLDQHPRLKKIAGNRNIPFLDDAQTLLDKLEPLIEQFTRNLEAQYGLKGITAEALACRHHWTLRFLNYFGNQPLNAILAAPHADKGMLTLHLYESDVGCEYYTLDTRRWKPLPVGHDETVIFGSMQLQQISEGALKALYHRVAATENTSRVGRLSMVCFILLDRRPLYKKNVYGSMQTHDVGFNYDMPNAQFQDLFHQKGNSIP